MVLMENRSSSHNLAFSAQKFIDSRRVCTNSSNKVRSGVTKTLIETTVGKTGQWFGEVVSLIIQTYQTNKKISLICVYFSPSRDGTRKLGAKKKPEN